MSTSGPADVQAGPSSAGTTRARNESSRELRGKILKEHEEARRNRDLLVKPGRKELSMTIQRLDVLASKVDRPREQADESDAFCFVSGKGAEMARAMGLAGQGRTPTDCIRRLVALYSNAEEVGRVQDSRDFAWKRLSEEVHLLKKHAPGMSCLLGPLAAEPKARRVAQRQERTKIGALEQPETLAAPEEGVKQDSDQVLEDLWSVLTEQPVINLLPLVLNYDSFAQTVENLFQLSFLVRDGKVGIADSEEGLVVTNLVAQRAKGKQRAAEGDTEMAMRLQFLMAYDMEDWRDWKTYYRREECRMRHRQPSQAPASAAQRPRQEDASQAPAAQEGRRKKSRHE